VENTSSWFPKAAGAQKILQAGVYTAELKSVNPGKGKGYQKGEETRDTLMFSFQEATTGAVINRTVSATTSEKSQLVALVRSMSGISAPTIEIIRDPLAFEKFIAAMVGKKYLIQVEPSRDGRFNNLITSFPAPTPL
jgi:hypothetical protein